MHSEDSQDFYQIAKDVEKDLKLPQYFMKLQVSDLVETDVFPRINEVILIKLMTEIKDNIINVDTITKIVEKRRTCVWYDVFKNYYEGILMVAKMQAFYQKHSGGFHTVEPEKIWQEYTTEYYMMDTWYREFHKRYSDSQKHSLDECHDLFIYVKDKVEGFYVTWFLGQLGNNWSDACAETLRERGLVIKVAEQTKFYEEKIHTSDNKTNSGNKIYVIISDSLRYEVGAVLAEQLQRETQAKVELNSMQAAFPTTTKFGMAVLLPHTQLSVELKNGQLVVLADGQSTAASNRNKILKIKNSASVALKYKDIIRMKRDNRRALVKGMTVVYIYHDTIDQAGRQEKILGNCPKFGLKRFS